MKYVKLYLPNLKIFTLSCVDILYFLGKIIYEINLNPYMSQNTTRAIVREANGRLILDDPDAVALGNAVNKHNCKKTLELNGDRVLYFKRHMQAKGYSPHQTLIFVLNVNDRNGGPLAEALMPGMNWQQFRDRGEIPFARGLVSREAIQGLLNDVDKDAAEKLRAVNNHAVVVMDHGAIDVFEA